MLWKVLDRAMNVSEVSAPGDAAFRATLDFASPIGHGLLGKACRGTHRAQLTFSSWNKVKAFGKLDATNLAQVHHSFVRAPREPLERSVVPCSSVDGFSSKPRAQLTFSSWNKVKAWQA